MVSLKRKLQKKYKILYKSGPSNVALLFAGLAISGWVSFLLLSGFPLVQYVYYNVRPVTSQLLAKVLSDTAVSAQEEQGVVNDDKEAVIDKGLPEQDVSLPGGHYLTIPKINLDTVIWEAPESEYESAIRKGVWRVPDLHDPMDGGQPVLLVAHRFGYLEWTNEYRRKNSFFNLPKLEPGDEIEIIWDQRRFVYKVTEVVEGEKIPSYDADLILYTCKFLVSPVRIFVYASRVN